MARGFRSVDRSTIGCATFSPFRDRARYAFNSNENLFGQSFSLATQKQTNKTRQAQLYTSRVILIALFGSLNLVFRDINENNQQVRCIYREVSSLLCLSPVCVVKWSSEYDNGRVCQTEEEVIVQPYIKNRLFIQRVVTICNLHLLFMIGGYWCFPENMFRLTEYRYNRL